MASGLFNLRSLMDATQSLLWEPAHSSMSHPLAHGLDHARFVMVEVGFGSSFDSYAVLFMNERIMLESIRNRMALSESPGQSRKELPGCAMVYLCHFAAILCCTSFEKKCVLPTEIHQMIIWTRP